MDMKSTESRFFVRGYVSMGNFVQFIFFMYISILFLICYLFSNYVIGVISDSWHYKTYYLFLNTMPAYLVCGSMVRI